MSGSKEIKNRIKSVKNTKKITKAMELVSASKMKKAVARALDSRTYAHEATRLLNRLKQGEEAGLTHPLLEKKTGDTTLLVVITSNGGLCGAYNAQILREMVRYTRTHADKKFAFILIGKKSEAVARRLGFPIVASFTGLPQIPDIQSVKSIADTIFTEYKNGAYREVIAFYTDYKSAITQVATQKILLPLQVAEDMGSSEPLESEPAFPILIDVLLEKLARTDIYQMLIESSASEHSARMLAMKNASDAAGEMISDLTLAFNKARQASITQEISEISAGMASVS